MAKRQGIQLCYPFEEKRLEKWEPPYLVQPKLDGERCRAECWVETRDDSKLDWFLKSSEQNIFNSVPHINKAIKDQRILRNMELDGELYLHGMNFSDIHSIQLRLYQIRRFPLFQPLFLKRITKLNPLTLSH